MKLILFILLFAFNCNSQITNWEPKFMRNFTSEQDLTFDYYSRVITVVGISNGLQFLKVSPIKSDLIALGIGASTCLFERGLDGKIVSSFGTFTGAVANIIIRHEKELRYERRHTKYVYKMKIFES